MATPLFSIGGLASGLDTTGIISQLMNLERAPITRFQQRQDELRKVDDAWASITTKLSSVRSSLDAVRGPGAVTGLRTVTSSAPDAVTATVMGTPAAGAFSFRVRQLAAAHQQSISFASADQLVGAGTFTIDAGGATASVTTTATTTVADLARELNAAAAGVGAQVIKVNDTETRLILTAKATGTAGAMTVTSKPAGVGALTTLQAARDAEIVLGTDDPLTAANEELVVTRSSNTVTDLVEGVTLTLKQTSDTPITITTATDADGAVKKVKALVDAVNSALTTMKDLSSYDADTRTGGVLQGDSTLRKLVSELRLAVSSGVPAPDGTLTSPSAIGIALDRYGAVTFDEAKLRKALTEDPATVDRVLSRSAGATDARVTGVTFSDATATGSYDVTVTAAATVASVTGSIYTRPSTALTYSITTGDKEVLVAVAKNDAVETVAAKINTALAAAGVSTLTATVQSLGPGQQALHLEETRYGSVGTFTISGTTDALLDATHAGTDVAGEFRQGDVTFAARGEGQRLIGLSGAASGLSALVAADAPGAYGRVDLLGGVAGALDAVLMRAEGTRDIKGSISVARESLKGEIRRYDDRISEFEVRLASRETTLRKKFAALETALANAQSQGAWLASQLGASQA